MENPNNQHFAEVNLEITSKILNTPTKAKTSTTNTSKQQFFIDSNRDYMKYIRKSPIRLQSSNKKLKSNEKIPLNLDESEDEHSQTKNDK
jgi:hypothetical protein